MSPPAGATATQTVMAPIVPPATRAAVAPPDEEVRCGCDLDREGARGAAVYNEAAFHYFLGVERLRAERSRRPFHLLTIDLEAHREAGSPAPAAEVQRVFAGLRESLRETDFLGWYRHGRVVGAVLPEFQRDPAAEAGRLTDRVGAALRRRLTPAAAARLQIHLQQCGLDTTDSDSPRGGKPTLEKA